MKVMWTERIQVLDTAIVNWMARHSIDFLRISLSLVFLWFGSLKLFPGLSPTIPLIERATEIATFGLVPGAFAVYVLAATECLIGIGLLFRAFMRLTLLLLFLQMLATSTPIVLMPEIVFAGSPYALTFEGHHIVKNLILLGAGLTIGATVRGGRFVPSIGKVA